MAATVESRRVYAMIIEKQGVIVMKRSEINAALKELEAMANEYKFALPPF